MKKATALLVFAVIGLLALPALADDINPPPWRGEYSTTSQVWDFMYPDVPGTPIFPDGPAFGGAPPLAGTYVVVNPNGAWIPTDPADRYGIWPLSGSIDVVVENHEPPNDFKLVWVHMTWKEMQPDGSPRLSEFYPAPAPTSIRFIGTEDLGYGWFETTVEWLIRPNPTQEAFTIGGDIYIDQLIVDTWCAPEPATMSLLAIGGLALLRRRSR